MTIYIIPIPIHFHSIIRDVLFFFFLLLLCKELLKIEWYVKIGWLVIKLYSRYMDKRIVHLYVVKNKGYIYIGYLEITLTSLLLLSLPSTELACCHVVFNTVILDFVKYFKPFSLASKIISINLCVF